MDTEDQEIIFVNVLISLKHLFVNCIPPLRKRVKHPFEKKVNKSRNKPNEICSEMVI